MNGLSMCATSAISDYYINTWPNHGQPSPSPFADVFADVETKEMLRKVLLLLDKIDKKLGDVECMDDKKAEFMKALDLRPEDFGG